MTVEAIFEDISSQQGWNTFSERIVLEAYIDNQQDNACFRDFLAEIGTEEGVDTTDLSADAIIAAAGWNDSTFVSLALRYISNQNSNDVFEDYLAQRAEEENSFSL
ncbi:hypothetical protein [Roseibium sp. RKSG952]|uniref:hypothetical protein n=1 Tax=Roseibium sp. RKSG952 TaxID=2529384 RepID=UPI0012BD73A5|nr:hypothetical protein [Roseibium sp. RKSG952]MTH94893.1 hypothetical protein [Roseibium sp. RKSG952]